MRKMLMLATAAVLMTVAGGAFAAEVEVKMLNKGAEGMMVFEPALVKVAPGRHGEIRSDGQGPQRRDHQGHASG
jgi:plastocyanin